MSLSEPLTCWSLPSSSTLQSGHNHRLLLSRTRDPLHEHYLVVVKEVSQAPSSPRSTNFPNVFPKILRE